MINNLLKKENLFKMNLIEKGLVLLILTVSLSSCEEFLEEDPKSFAAPELLIESEAGADQMLNGVYNSMYRYGWRYYLMVHELTSDGLTFPQVGFIDRIELDEQTYTSQNPNIDRLWQGNVYGINRTNIIIDHITPEILERSYGAKAMAEARFLRAWFYFIQVRSFGKVPLITEYFESDFFPPNAEISDIYEVIVDDLLYAEQHLPNWRNLPESEAGRATSGAAKSLLAWVYLTRATENGAAKSDDYANAAAKAKEVIDNEGYELWDDYGDAFLASNKNDKEDIFSHQYLAGAPNPLNQRISMDFSPGGTAQYGIENGWNMFGLTNALYSLYHEDDERRRYMWPGYVTDLKTGDPLIFEGDIAWLNNPNDIFCMKYRDLENESKNMNGVNFPYIRYSNVLLIHAEAVLESLGAVPDAYLGLNKVRVRSDLPALNGLGSDDLRQAIRDERFKEFVGEGIRWFDLKRWGLLEQNVEAAKPDVDVVLPKALYFPIPQQELDANPNLEQNPGYQ